jgi:hypothetical protein
MSVEGVGAPVAASAQVPKVDKVDILVVPEEGDVTSPN